MRAVGRHPRLARLLRADPDPQRSARAAVAAAAATLVVGASAIGLLLLMIRSETGVAPVDVRFAQFAADHATAVSTSLLRRISLLGGTSGVVLVAAVAAIAELARSRSRAAFAFLAVVVGGQFALSNLIKLVVDRARPAIDQLTGFAGTSFPSGHSTAAAATFAGIALLLGRTRSQSARVVLSAAAAGIAVAVAATRVLLGVHWFTDVVAGLVLGWTWFAICSIAFGGRWLHFGAPVELAEQVAERAPERVTQPTIDRSGAALDDAGPDDGDP